MSIFAELKEEVDTPVEYQEGQILQLHSLSKADLNGQIVEVQRRVESTNGICRWGCVLTGAPNKRVAAKPSNLKPCDPPTDAKKKRLEQLLESSKTLDKTCFGNRGLIGSPDELQLLRETVDDIIELSPDNGAAYAIKV